MKLHIYDQKTLRIDLAWYEKIFAFKMKSIEIPLEHIVEASIEKPQTTWKTIRAPGTYIPGVIKAGTYHKREEKEFWYTTTGKRYLTIELKDEEYKRIVLGFDENRYWANRINNLI